MPTSAPAATANSRARAIVSDSLVSGLVFALALTVTQRLLGVIRGVLFCRLMTDDELGQWSMIHGVLMTLAPLAVLGLPGSFGKFVEHYSQTGQLRSFLRNVGRVCAAMTVLFAVAMLCLPDFFSYQILGETGHDGQIRLSALVLLALTWMNYLTSLVESMRQIRLATWIRFFSGTSFTLIAVVLLTSPLDHSLAALISFGVSCLIGAIPAVWYLRRQRSWMASLDEALPARELWVRLAPFAAWWWVSNIIHNSFELVDRYMLVHWSGLQPAEVLGALGQYHSSRVVPMLMVGVAAMLSGLLMPYVSAAWTAGELGKARQQLNLTIKVLSLGMVVGNALMLASAPLLFDWLLQGRYDEGLAILPLTLIYCTWFSLMTVSQDYLWVSEQGKFAVLCMALGLLANIAFNALMIPWWGLWGAVIATALGNLLGAAGLYAANHRQGCPPDRGCWVSLGLPLVLLADPWVAVILSLLVLVVSLATRVLFSRTELEMMYELVNSKLGRFAVRRP